MAKTFKTVKDVELARVGTWNASTGKSSITRDHLDSVVEAFESGDLTLAPIKIGHTDPRFDNPTWDGDPAYGQVDNLRVKEDRGGTLVGDYINVPEELADKLASAYPHRSVELNFDTELVDAEGNVLATYAAVLTGVALLGASAPAVEGLATVQAAFSAAAKNRHVKMGARTRIGSASMFTAKQAAPVRRDFSLAGGHTYETLHRALNEAIRALPALPGDEYDFRWLEDYDDTHVWHTSGEQLLQREYSVLEDGTAVVATEYVPVTVRRVYEPAEPDTPAVPQAVAASAESSTVSASAMAADQTKTEGEADMAFTESQLKKLRSTFGLSDAATEDEVLAAIDAADTDDQEQAGAGEAGEQGQTPTEAEAPADANEAPADEAPAAGQHSAAAPVAEPTPSVSLSAANFAALQNEVATLRADARARQEAEAKTRRDGAISTALSAGVLHPSEEKAWREALDKHEDSTMVLLSARRPAFPTVELGADTAPYAQGSDALSEAVTAAEDRLFNIGGK